MLYNKDRKELTPLGYVVVPLVMIGGMSMVLFAAYCVFMSIGLGIYVATSAVGCLDGQKDSLRYEGDLWRRDVAICEADLVSGVIKGSPWTTVPPLGVVGIMAYERWTKRKSTNK